MSAIALEGALDVSLILKPGVYALVRRGVVIYVGKSKSVYQRIYTHRTTANRKARGQAIPTWLPIQGFVFDQVFVWTCTLEELDALEAEKINLYQPRFNQSLKDARLRGKLPLRIDVLGVEMVLGGAKPEVSPAVGGLRRL